MSNNKTRAEFEEWCSRNPLKTDKRACGEYKYVSTDLAWQAWQASRAAQVVELPRLQGDAQYDGQEVIDALDAAGVAYK